MEQQSWAAQTGTSRLILSDVPLKIPSPGKSRGLDKVGHANSTKGCKCRCVWTCGICRAALLGCSLHHMQVIHAKSAMIFKMHVDSCRHDHRQVFVPPQWVALPFSCHSNPTLPPRLICFLSLWICLGGTFYINGIGQYVVTFDWSLSLGLRFPWLIQMASWVHLHSFS